MKKLTIATILIAIIGAGFFSWQYYQYRQSFLDINFEFTEADMSADIYNQNRDDERIASVSNSRSSIKLRQGDYFFRITTSKFNDEQQDFSIEKSDQTISIDADYSKEHLDKELEGQLELIHKTIKSRHPDAIGQYDIKRGELLLKGEWYGTVLLPKDLDSRDIADPYRVLLRKTDDEWSVVRYPEYILTKSNYPDIPLDILNKVNNLPTH